MRTPDFVIMQGSTPNIEIVMPMEMGSTSMTVYADLIQDNQIVLEYTDNGTAAPEAIRPTGTLTEDLQDNHLMILSMTQADTLTLKPGDVLLQLRYIVGGTDADTSVPVRGYVGKAFKQGVLT